MPIPTTGAKPTGDFVAFFRAAEPYRRDPTFEEREIDYKLRLSHALGRARAALLAGDPSWRDQLEKALRSRENNIISWRVIESLVKDLRAADLKRLRKFWGDSTPAQQRFTALGQLLTAPDLRKPGMQLTIGSTLLMALGGTENPPIRTRTLNSAFSLVGVRRFGKEESPAARYVRAIEFLDRAVAEGPLHNVATRHRLDAQGIVWCVGGGWKTEPTEGKADLSDEEAAAVVEAERNGASLSATERQALIRARLGQGLFRDRLLELWGSCAVTGCGDSRLLRASHLKPWRKSTNPERLSANNGLLLTPNLDVALDQGLIAFADDGAIMISPRLRKQDQRAAGISKHLRLRFVLPSHLPFLRYHRSSIFKAAKTAQVA